MNLVKKFGIFTLFFISANFLCAMENAQDSNLTEQPSQKVVGANRMRKMISAAIETLKNYKAKFKTTMSKNNQNEQEAPKKQIKVFYESSDINAPLVKEPVEKITLATYYMDYPLVSKPLKYAADKFGKKITEWEANKKMSEDPKKVKKLIDHYLKLYKNQINMDQFIVPEGGFKSFNNWFIRQLKNIDVLRPMDHNPDAIVSPADSKLIIIPDISQNATVFIKEEKFDLVTFLGGNKNLADQYEGGVMMIFRLAPYDYHRYHYPIDCRISSEVLIPGKYHSVSPGAYTSNVKPLTVNKRSYELLQPAGSMEKYSNNTVVMVQVGALAVASIVNHFTELYRQNVYKDAPIFNKGKEMGYFQFGGSTLVLLFKPRTIIPNPQIVKNSQNGYETAVKVRETVAYWNDSLPYEDLSEDKSEQISGFEEEL